MSKKVKNAKVQKKIDIQLHEFPFEDPKRIINNGKSAIVQKKNENSAKDKISRLWKMQKHFRLYNANPLNWG